MNTITCMKTRRSTRSYRPDKVSHELLEQIIDAASYAPSWKNTQVTRYIAVEDPALKEQLANECAVGNNQRMIKAAPVVIATTLIEGRSGFERDGSFTTVKGREWQAYDCGIAGGMFSLAAHELGLASVIIGIFDYDKAAALLKVPEGQTLMSLIALGYPDEEPAVPKKKTVSDLLSYR